MSEFEPLLTDAEVGEMLRMKARTVQRMAAKGELPSRKVGRYWRFRRSWIERWMDGESVLEITGGENAAAIPGRPSLAAQRQAN